MKLISFALFPALSSAFTSIPGTSSTQNRINVHALQMSLNTPKPGSGSSLEGIFKGGAFNDDFTKEEIISSAVAIASKIKSTKDLGWKNDTPKRKGNARPRSRAWGGEKEEAVQDKANYDEENPKCVEKWLTMEDFLANTKAQPGPAADTVFVALAGGAKYAERDVCEAKIEKWTASTMKKSEAPPVKAGFFGRRGGAASTFNEASFIKSVEEGRRDLFLGYASFISLNSFFAACIAFPTNPGAKALEHLVDALKDQVAPL